MLIPLGACEKFSYWIFVVNRNLALGLRAYTRG